MTDKSNTQAALVDILKAVRKQARHPDYDWPMDLQREVDAALADQPTPEPVAQTDRCEHGIRLPHECSACADSHSDAEIKAWIQGQRSKAMPDAVRSLIEGMSVSVDVSTNDDDADHRYFGTVTEVMDDLEDKHGVTLLVQNAVPNFAAPSPVALQGRDELREAARLLHNLTLGDSTVIVRAPSAEKRDAIIEAGKRLRSALAARASLPTGGVVGYGKWAEGLPPGTRLMRHDGVPLVYAEPRDGFDVALYATPQPSETPAPIPMVLHCPKCGMQHIDGPEEGTSGMVSAEGFEPGKPDWTNPDHRSHLCHGCGTIWRPADVPTTGVKATATKGKTDNWAPSETQGRRQMTEDGDAL